ncbi:hypothetical protein ANTPLA_LOCUS9525 [Anthophora plagiata]
MPEEFSPVRQQHLRSCTRHRSFPVDQDLSTLSLQKNHRVEWHVTSLAKLVANRGETTKATLSKKRI